MLASAHTRLFISVYASGFRTGDSSIPLPASASASEREIPSAARDILRPAIARVPACRGIAASRQIRRRRQIRRVAKTGCVNGLTHLLARRGRGRRWLEVILSSSHLSGFFPGLPGQILARAGQTGPLAYFTSTDPLPPVDWGSRTGRTARTSVART